MALVLLASGCTGDDPTLLRESDFAGVVESEHRPDSGPPGGTWCSGLRVGAGRIVAHSSMALSEDRRTVVGATLIDLADDPVGADELFDELGERAALCEDNDTALSRGYSIEPLDGLGHDTVGWRTGTSDGEHGEYAVARIGEAQVVAVGWVTSEPMPPVTTEELLRLARDGADRVGSGG